MSNEALGLIYPHPLGGGCLQGSRWQGGWGIGESAASPLRFEHEKTPPSGGVFHRTAICYPNL